MLYCIKYTHGHTDGRRSEITSSRAPVGAKHEGIKFPCDQCDYNATLKHDLFRHMKRKHKLSNAGNKQEKKTLDLAVDDNGDDDFISEDEDDRERRQEEEEGVKQQFICPISSCTFFLWEKNTKSELDHLKESHPHVKNHMSFLMLQ